MLDPQFTRDPKKAIAFGVDLAAAMVLVAWGLFPLAAEQSAFPSPVRPKLILQAPAGAGPGSLAFSPDGARLAGGYDDDTLRLWDGQTGQLLRTLGQHLGEVMSVAFSPSGRLLASGSNNGTLKLWDAVTGRRIRTLNSHQSMVTSVAFSP